MKTLRDRVAVITGAASGFGREFALACAREGMRLVLSDVDESGLHATDDLLKSSGAQTLLVKCNVAEAAEVEALAEQTYARFGAAHLLFNNAGVAASGPLWTATAEDWQWVLGVNLMGVVHGIRSFVPRMLAQKDACHIVNTASAAGLISVPGASVYGVSKHGVVTLSESLHHELRLVQAAIGVSVLCPAFVNTGIADSARNRPAELAPSNPQAAPFAQRVRKALDSAQMTAADIARITLAAVKADRFYIVTHEATKAAVEMRLRDILDARTPTDPMP